MPTRLPLSLCAPLALITLGAPVCALDDPLDPFVPLTIQDGDSTARIGILPTALLFPFADANIGGVGFDPILAHHWYYRIGDDPVQTRLDATLSQCRVSGNSLERTFADPRGVEFLHTFTIQDGSDGQALIASSLRVTNTSDEPVAIDVFGYTEPSIVDPFNDTVAIFGAAIGFVMRATDPVEAPDFDLTVHANFDSGALVGEVQWVRTALETGRFDVFIASPPVAGPGRVAGVHQWVRPALAPGTSFDAQFTIHVNQAPGACCLPTPGIAPDCRQMGEGGCAAAGGTFQGLGTSCVFCPEACQCDWDLDGALADQDFFAFANDFFDDVPPGSPNATPSDFNDDGFENNQDFFDFVNCFFLGGVDGPGGYRPCVEGS